MCFKTKSKTLWASVSFYYRRWLLPPIFSIIALLFWNYKEIEIRSHTKCWRQNTFIIERTKMSKLIWYIFFVSLPISVFGIDLSRLYGHLRPPVQKRSGKFNFMYFVPMCHVRPINFPLFIPHFISIRLTYQANCIFYVMNINWYK